MELWVQSYQLATIAVTLAGAAFIVSVASLFR